MIDGCSIKGVRESNQDAFAIGVVHEGMMDIRLSSRGDEERFSDTTSLPEGCILILVADGMGGLSNGEQASFLTLNCFLEMINDVPIDTIDLTGKITDTVKRVSSDLRVYCPDSGSTIVGAIICGDVAWIFNVGDSKCIATDGSRIYRSEDHSPDQDCGSNYITAYMGMDGDFDVHIDLLYGFSSILLFSDGLNPLFIKEGFTVFDSVYTCDEMCQRSLDLGSTDNITCVMYSKGV